MSVPALAVLFAVLALLAGCQNVQTADPGETIATPATPAPPVATTRYLCCNLHSESDWFSDGNFLVGRRYPLGTEVTVKDARRGVAYLEIEGRPMRLGHEYGRRQESFDQFMRRYLVTVDPRARLAGYPPEIQRAIRQAKLLQGMTREQVLLSIGYPPAHGTASLEAADWTYWYNRFTTYIVRFDEQDRVREIVADPRMRARLVQQ